MVEGGFFIFFSNDSVEVADVAFCIALCEICVSRVVMSSGVQAKSIRKAAVLMDVHGVSTSCEVFDIAYHQSSSFGLLCQGKFTRDESELLSNVFFSCFAVLEYNFGPAVFNSTFTVVIGFGTQGLGAH